jgi:hypothetical protein
MSANEARRPLADAAAKRTLAAEQRVRAALRELDSDGAAVTFAAVAQPARVFPRVPLPARRAAVTDRGATHCPGGRPSAPAGPPARQRQLNACPATRRAG